MKEGEKKQGKSRKHADHSPVRESERPAGTAGPRPGGQAAEAGADELSALREKAARAEEYYERLLRLQAEFENYKKRTQKEKAEWLSQANQELILALLPVVDSFELGLDSAKKTRDFDTLLKGLELTLDELLQVLRKFGLNSVEAAGRKFDPNFHEAVTLVDSDVHQDDTVVDEIRRGYLLNNKLIRPSMVTVARSVRPPVPEGRGTTDAEGAEEDGDRRA